MGNSPTHDELMNATEYDVGIAIADNAILLTKRGTTYAEAIENQHTFLQINLQSGYQPSIYVLNSGSEMLTTHHYENERNKRIIDFACRMATNNSKYDYSIDTTGNYPLVVRN